MGRKRTHTRRSSKALPKGVLDVRLGGYGFVQTAEGEYFIPEAKLGCAFNGDLVEISPLPRTSSKGLKSQGGGHSVSGQDRPAARIVRVIDRAHDTLVGRYEIAEPFGVVVPEDPRMHHDIFTMRSDNPDIPDGSLVRVRITTFPGRGQAATGYVEEVLGDENDRSLDIEVIVARYKFERRFSDASLAQADACVVDVEGALSEGYRDIRDRLVFTVDPDDAKDFDDAISLEPVQGQKGIAWRLGVHIADVSHYVPWDSSIDLDARRRATSVYLADRVIPMLPEKLSNDVCSLRPNEDRRAVTVDLFLNDKGIVVSSDAYPSVIRSRARLTYAQALSMMQEDSDTSPATQRLRTLSDIAQKRESLRMQRGGLDFDSVEAKVRFDSTGSPVGVQLKRKTLSTSLIEEAMIMANEAVARLLNEHSFPNVYRVHERPAPENLEALIPVLREFDWFADIDEYRFVSGDGSTIARVVQLAKGRPESELVSSLVLRSMKRADYRPMCDEHYGLASTAYSHFTSPIRRYPDLVTHRMLKAFWLSKRGAKARGFDQQVQSLAWLCEHSSKMERLAEKAARDSQECKIIELLVPHVGQAFDGVVSGVMTYGLYVRLGNTAEGLLPLSNLGQEYFSFDPERHTLTGEDSGTSFRLGQRVSVVIVEAEPRLRTLSFRLAHDFEKAAPDEDIVL